MQPALWISKTGLEAQDKNIATIANNLANVSTTGFKKGRAVFEDLIYQNLSWCPILRKHPNTYRY